MSEEEKKAIEILKNMDIDWRGVTSCNKYSYVDDEHRCFDDINGDCQMVAIKTILNLIENQKAEIEDKQDEINVLEAQRDSIENQFEQAKVEIEKKDKMIDLMAKELVKAHKWFYSEFDNYTKEDFIKYFEKKSEEE